MLMFPNRLPVRSSWSLLLAAGLIMGADAFAPQPSLHRHRHIHTNGHEHGLQNIYSPCHTQQRHFITTASMMNPQDFEETLASHAPSLQTAALQIQTLIAQEDDPLKYAFMFPVVTSVSVICQSAGIGGAALLSPIFLLVFPLLGPQYPLETAASAIASALLTECFGFLSGLSGYWRRGLVDWTTALKFLGLALPAALCGAVVEPALATQTTVLRTVYAALMLSLSIYLIVSERPTQLPDDCPVPPEGTDGDELTTRTKQGSDGTIYTYLQPASPVASWKTVGATVSGASLTGLLGVGIGEVVLPQLVRVACVPLPIAAGTSVAVVVLTALTAASVQFFTLAAALVSQNPDLNLQQALVQVIPWSLVQYTVPGAILGGQIAPWLTSRRILDDETVEMVVAVLFGLIGTAFAAKLVIG